MRTLLILLLLLGPAHAAGVLRYGLEQDPDVLDPARNGSYGDRVVFTAMCDQLLDIDPQLNYVPQLATSWAWSDDRLALTLKLRPGVVFQDGAPMDAEAVRLNLERYRSAPESLRRTELAPVVGVDVIDPLTLRIRLSAPYAPLLSLLANRPGTPLSPRILGRTPDEIAADPVCAGPFRFVSRVAQDRIVLQRFPGYWNAGAIALDGIEFRIATDATVRRVNLQSGALDVVGRVAPTDVSAIEADRRSRVLTFPSLGYQILTFNLNRGPKADTPFARDGRVREAFEKSIDREALNQVVFEGRYVPSNQTEAPGTRYYDASYPVPKRDLAGARALLRAAGLERTSVGLIVPNDPVTAQVGQVIQAMAAEAGIDVQLTQAESATTVAATKGGANDRPGRAGRALRAGDGPVAEGSALHGAVPLHLVVGRPVRRDRYRASARRAAALGRREGAVVRGAPVPSRGGQHPHGPLPAHVGPFDGTRQRRPLHQVGAARLQHRRHQQGEGPAASCAVRQPAP